MDTPVDTPVNNVRILNIFKPFLPLICMICRWWMSADSAKVSIFLSTFFFFLASLLHSANELFVYSHRLAQTLLWWNSFCGYLHNRDEFKLCATKVSANDTHQLAPVAALTFDGGLYPKRFWQEVKSCSGLLSCNERVYRQIWCFLFDEEWD